VIQDIAPRLENEFFAPTPQAEDIVLCFQDNRTLVRHGENDTLFLPTYTQVAAWAGQESWTPWEAEGHFRYVFKIGERNFFIWRGQAGSAGDGFDYEIVRTLRQTVSKDVCFAAYSAYHLYIWYRDNRRCGRCGAATVHDEKERMLRCPDCGNMIFPKIAPAVITAVTDGDRILMSKYAGRLYKRYSLIAGFCEFGETAEQTVQREVMEEVGLRVKNIRYYKSQPWGVDSNLLLGFFCDLDGDDAITKDDSELAMAGWYDRSDMPAHDDGISLTREMMRIFEEGREPR
jgi:NAD+ diphosphatase